MTIRFWKICAAVFASLLQTSFHPSQCEAKAVGSISQGFSGTYFHERARETLVGNISLFSHSAHTHIPGAGSQPNQPTNQAASHPPSLGILHPKVRVALSFIYAEFLIPISCICHQTKMSNFLISHHLKDLTICGVTLCAAARKRECIHIRGAQQQQQSTTSGAGNISASRTIHYIIKDGGDGAKL